MSKLQLFSGRIAHLKLVLRSARGSPIYLGSFCQTAARKWCACQGWTLAKTNFQKDVYANRKAFINAATMEELVDALQAESREAKSKVMMINMSHSKLVDMHVHVAHRQIRNVACWHHISSSKQAHTSAVSVNSVGRYSYIACSS